MKVVIAGGGTAGHVNPAIALARALDGNTVSFIGTSKGAEARLVPAAGFELHEIDVVGFDRAKPWLLPATAARAAGALADARAILKQKAPDVVVGMGGYVSLPAVLAARSLKTPVVLHEQNIVFGLAHKASKPLATKIAVSFEDTLKDAGGKGVYVGNPIAPEFASFDRSAARSRAVAAFELEPGRKTLLVFGGSQGARRINEAAAGLQRLWRDRDDLQVLHIAGPSAYSALAKSVEQAAGRHGCIYRLVEFVDDMTLAYGVADLALCRGGATTLAELAVVGLPAIIVPYPYHRDRQQERQARVVASHGAAVVLEDSATTTDAVAGRVELLFDDVVRLSQMSASFKDLARPHAAQQLAQVVREVAA